jgi:hypothetical protein
LRYQVSVIAIAAICFASATARADPLEVNTDVLLREEPNDNSRIVERAHAGTNVILVHRSSDGAYLLVRVGRKEGWAPRTFFKGNLRGQAASLAPRTSPRQETSLAPPRLDRPEAWVSNSSYYLRNNQRVRAAETTAIRARPDATSQQLGVLASGETLKLRRLSTDQSWAMVTIGGGESGWVQMATVKIENLATPEGEPGQAVHAAREGKIAEAQVVTVVKPPEPSHALLLAAAVGVAGIDRRLVSNGSGALAAYEVDATAVVALASAGWARAFKRHGLVAVDASYLFAGAARVRYRDSATTAIMSLSQHQAGAGVTLGVRGDAAGGIDAWLRGGAELTLTIIDPNVAARLASDRLIAPTVAIGFDAARLAAPGGHAIGLHLFARGLLYGQMSENLSDGSEHGTWGATFGGSISADLWRSRRGGDLLLALGYNYGFTQSRFTGAADRDPTATKSTLGSAQHLGTLAFAYAY